MVKLKQAPAGHRSHRKSRAGCQPCKARKVKVLSPLGSGTRIDTCFRIVTAIKCGQWLICLIFLNSVTKQSHIARSATDGVLTAPMCWRRLLRVLQPALHDVPMLHG